MSALPALLLGGKMSSILWLNPFLPSQQGHQGYWQKLQSNYNFSLEMHQIAASVKQFTNLFQVERCLFSKLSVCLQQTLQKMWVCPVLLDQLILQDSAQTQPCYLPFPPHQE